MTLQTESWIAPVAAADTEWDTGTPLDRCEDLATVMHERLRTHLPRIGLLLYRVAEGDAGTHPELPRLLELFSQLSGEVKLHLAHEETLLLPWLHDRVEVPLASDEAMEMLLPLEVEQQNARRLLAQIRAMTHDYSPPADACAAYRSVLRALEHLEREVADLIGFEDNILYPRILNRPSNF